MRNPNGYGSVVKLSGRRRKPYMVRRTSGYNDKGYPIYQIIGYAATRAEGNIMLAEYNKSPYDTENARMTFSQLYEAWEKTSGSLSDNYRKALAVAFRKAEPLHDKIYRDLKTYHMQEITDASSPSTQGSIKSLFAQLDDYAMRNDIIPKGYAEFITTADYKAQEKKPFTEEEINTLWQHTDNDICCHALILIYSGWRINEYFSVDIDLENAVMTGGIKSEAGKNRKVPIHDRTLPLVRRLYKDGRLYHESESIFRRLWSKMMDYLDMDHTIHETRHTFVTRLDNADVPRVIIDKLAGHAGKGTGEKVYTHKTIEELRKAVNQMT